MDTAHSMDRCGLGSSIARLFFGRRALRNARIQVVEALEPFRFAPVAGTYQFSGRCATGGARRAEPFEIGRSRGPRRLTCRLTLFST